MKETSQGVSSGKLPDTSFTWFPWLDLCPYKKNKKKKGKEIKPPVKAHSKKIVFQN